MRKKSVIDLEKVEVEVDQKDGRWVLIEISKVFEKKLTICGVCATVDKPETKKWMKGIRKRMARRKDLEVT